MENVFCLSRSELEKMTSSPLINGLWSSPDLADLLNLNHYFIPRTSAENNPDFKQIIPYQLFYCEQSYFVFQRGKKSGEQRLAGRLSLGIGGHINDKDSSNGRRMSQEDFNKALERERHEELICPPELTTEFMGWINDDTDQVGQVHLGVACRCLLPDKSTIKIRPDGEDLQAVGWLTSAEIHQRKDEFERWSIISLQKKIY